MLNWIATTALAVILLFAGVSEVPAAGAAPVAVQKSSPAKASDLSPRRHYRHRYAYTYRPYYPYYYGRPYYYSPGPFLLPWFDDWGPW